jgi:hypothetical protein
MALIPLGTQGNFVHVYDFRVFHMSCLRAGSVSSGPQRTPDTSGVE